MSEITAITPQKHDPTRCNIEVDGRFFCGMKLETVLGARLKVGSPVDGEMLAALQLESEKKEVLDKALSFISSSMKTEKEVRDHLARKGYLEDVCDDAVSRMKEYGYLDDAAYARAYVESAGKKKGGRLIALELRRKGISAEEIGEAVGGLAGGETAKAVLAKYLRGKDISDRAVIRKAFNHLLSKGFSYEEAREALGALADDGE